MPASASATGLHWQVAQATSLFNVIVEMSTAEGNNHQGDYSTSSVQILLAYSSHRNLHGKRKVFTLFLSLTSFLIKYLHSVVVSWEVTLRESSHHILVFNLYRQILSLTEENLEFGLEINSMYVLLYSSIVELIARPDSLFVI
jgi:Pectate lyase superfamily protein